MTSIRKILVPIKELGGRPSPAIVKAAQVARACGAGIELLHVLTLDRHPIPILGSVSYFRTLEDEAREAALLQLEDIADALRKHRIKVSVSAVWDYPPHEAILRRAAEIRANLIIVLQHAGKHHLPWLMRLTDWELIRSSPIPVLLVKSRHPYRRPAILAAVDPSHARGKTETLDKAILHTAGAWCSALRGTLHAVHAYTRFPVNMPAEALTPGMLDDLQQEAAQLARKRFARTVGPHRVPVKRQHLQALPPAEAITVTARETRCSIVVMGVMSRSGVKRLLIGNTAEHILDTLTCDVLVVKGKGAPGGASAVRRAARRSSK